MKRNAALLSALTVGLALTGASAGQAAEPSEERTMSPVAEAEHYKVTSSATCSGDACTATIVLEAVGGFHVNKDYRHKFLVDKDRTSGAEASKASFSDGDFSFGETRGTMTITAKASAAKATLGGTFRFAVCSESNCEPSSVPLTIRLR